jgi:quercetin dioxygenase-like cupin family protein
MTSLQTSQTREKILELQAAMQAKPEQHIDLPVKHYFIPGIYMREMPMPKDCTVVGKIHKTEHFLIVTKGSISIANDNGAEIFTAPCVIHSMPGTKRALHALEESICMTVHPNPSNETDIDKIDDLFVVDTHEQFLSFQETKQISGGNSL